MTRKLKVLLATLMTAALVGGSAAPGGALEARAEGDANNFLFAAGGTPLTNGIFFPGTVFCSGEECTEIGPPLTIDKGDDVTFVNLDAGPVTNSHQIVSLKKRKSKKKPGPLFSSDEVSGPGQTVMKMSHVKPGTYIYLCTFHFGMYGQIEVVKPGTLPFP